MDELEEMISEDITLDSRVHARIIGARGKGIRKIMDEFKVKKMHEWLLQLESIGISILLTFSCISPILTLASSAD